MYRKITMSTVANAHLDLNVPPTKHEPANERIDVPTGSPPARPNASRNGSEGSI